MRISDWSSDVCSSDLLEPLVREHLVPGAAAHLEDLEALGELLVGDVDRGDEAVARVLLHPVEVLEDAGLRGVWACGAQGRDEDVGGAPAHYREEVEVGTGGGALVQIGRASCRERVCQYEYIAEVAC